MTHDMAGVGFINPYTFIPFGTVKRQRPPGHAPDPREARERFTGSFTVTWEIKTPLACPAPSENAPAEWGTPETGLRVPGSYIKGAIRCVHEVLFGGCLRQVDLDFTPIYRELPSPGALEDYRLGTVVTEPDRNGEGCRIRVLPTRDGKGRVYSANAEALARALPKPPTDGQVVRMRPAPKGNSANRALLEHDPDGQPYLVHITGQGARNPKYPFYWALGAVRDTFEATVSPEVLTSFRWRARNARDSGPTEVRRNKTLLGYLKKTGDDLCRGEMVWVKVEGGQVVDIKRSQLWRRQAGGDRPTVRDRLPDGLSPCREADRLCLTCQVFGSADTDGPGDGKATQHSYSGHVRFGPAHLTDAADWATETLAPLGQPHPGAGMMYLTPQHDFGDPRDSADRRSRWDVPGDKRDLRGRKFYWFSDPIEQQRRYGDDKPRRYLKRDHHTNETTNQAILVGAGCLVQRITFDGLDRVSLLSLLAALEPSRILGGDGFAHHLGRGKPLGLGAVTATISGFSATTVADRYLAAPTPLSLDTFAHTPQDEASLEQRCGDQRAVRQVARKVLRLDGLGSDAWRVSYPTTRPWSEFGTDKFDKSFEFYKDYGGPAQSQKGKPSWKLDSYLPMPEAADPDQIMRGQR